TAGDLTQPGHGTVTLNTDGSFSYVPATDFSGTDSFSYKANDGTNKSAAAIVTINVTATTSDTAPTAVNDSYSTGVEDTALAIPVASGVLTNDTDPEHNQLTATDATQPGHG